MPIPRCTARVLDVSVEPSGDTRGGQRGRGADSGYVEADRQTGSWKLNMRCRVKRMDGWTSYTREKEAKVPPPITRNRFKPMHAPGVVSRLVKTVSGPPGEHTVSVD